VRKSGLWFSVLSGLSFCFDSAVEFYFLLHCFCSSSFSLFFGCRTTSWSPSQLTARSSSSSPAPARDFRLCAPVLFSRTVFLFGAKTWSTLPIFDLLTKEHCQIRSSGLRRDRSCPWPPTFKGASPVRFGRHTGTRSSSFFNGSWFLADCLLLRDFAARELPLPRLFSALLRFIDRIRFARRVRGFLVPLSTASRFRLCSR
jgi:hypothetical protein